MKIDSAEKPMNKYALSRCISQSVITSNRDTTAITMYKNSDIL